MINLSSSVTYRSVMIIRSARLTAMVLLLEARGSLTAQALAQHFDVSVRTIFRDMDALSAAGIPVYAERGPHGGYRLMDGYRLRPPALTAAEAGALWLSGLPNAAAVLGRGADLASAQMKLLAVMGPDQQAETTRIQELLFVDQPGWFGATDAPEYLSHVWAAVWAGAIIRVRYQSWTAETARTLEPLGMVLKGGTWYLVARDPERPAPRTYRVSQIRDYACIGQRVSRPADFDLVTYWQAASAAFVQRIYSREAIIRVAPTAVRDLHHLGSAVYLAGLQEVAAEDGDGWRHFRLPFENVREAARDFVRLGGDVEVLAPAELRAEVVQVAAAIIARMGTIPVRGADPL